jgi:hypothetical protein
MGKKHYLMQCDMIDGEISNFVVWFWEKKVLASGRKMGGFTKQARKQGMVMRSDDDRTRTRIKAL